jgi:hypothetical protein
MNSLPCLVELEIYQRFCCNLDCLDSSTTSKIAFLSKPVEEAFNVPKSSIEPLRQPIYTYIMEEDAIA